MSRFMSEPQGKILSVCLLCLFLGGVPIAGNPFLITEESDYIYGQGVHAFFDRNYEEAVTILLRAEAIDTEDPRPYYFLGLAYLRQKQTEKADQYFRKAAQLEYSGRALRDYAVSESLRRIQGEERLRLETIRTAERANARIREQRIREARYGSNTAAAREALRDSLPQISYENAAALREVREVNRLGENAFDLHPLNPIGTPEESAVTRRAESTNPFGSVAASTAGDSGMSDAGQPSLAELLGAVAVPERTPLPIVEVNTTSTGRPSTAPGSPAMEFDTEQHPMGMLPVGVSALAVSPSSTLLQSGAPRQLGRALGALFAKQADSD